MCSVADNLCHMGASKVIYELVRDGQITPEVGATKLGISVGKLKADMKVNGHEYSTQLSKPRRKPRNMCDVTDNLCYMGASEIVYDLVNDGQITPEVGAAKLGISVRKIKDDISDLKLI